MKVAELEAVFTAQIDKLEKGARKADQIVNNLNNLKATVEVLADTTKADSEIDQARRILASTDGEAATLEVLADSGTATAEIDQAQAALKGVDGQAAEARIDADASPAKDEIDQARRQLQQLDGEQVEMKVDADTSGAQQALGELADAGESAGADAGQATGSALLGGVKSALGSIPVAGGIVAGVVGIGTALGKSFVDQVQVGLQAEVRTDMLGAQTGLDPATVAGIGSAAGEAYANNFGSSIEENMQTARIAIQSGLLDPDATKIETQKVIEQLSGVAQIMGEDIPTVARSAGQAIRTGIVEDGASAFDLLVKAQQNGLNVAGDLLDTFDEYSTKFRDLGLSGQEAFGLIQQGYEGGARDVDVMADALKEFQISVTDNSATTRQAFQDLGMDADDMYRRFIEGGPVARDAFGEVLTAIQGIEDPTLKSAIQLALFKTKAEDIGTAINAMDLKTAAAEFGEVGGAAGAAISQMGDNAAGRLASARRNIEVAFGGIRDSFVQALSPAFEKLADFVTENRTTVVGFLVDVVDGFFNVGRAAVEGVATATDGFGSFLSGPGADLLEFFGNLAHTVDAALPGDQHGDAMQQWAKGAADDLRDAGESVQDFADDIRTNLIENGIDKAQARFDDFGISLITQAEFHDAQTQMGNDIANLASEAEAAGIQLDGLTANTLDTTESGRQLNEKLIEIQDGFNAEVEAAVAVGASQQDLTTRQNELTDALAEQLAQLGMAPEAARALAESYLTIPDSVEPLVTSIGSIKQAAADAGVEFVGLTADTLGSTDAGRLLQQKLLDVQTAFYGEIDAARNSGASQDELKVKHDGATQALYNQLVAMGLNKEEATALAQKYLAIPDDVTTNANMNSEDAAGKATDLDKRIRNIPGYRNTSANMNSEGAAGKATDLDKRIRNIPGYRNTSATMNSDTAYSKSEALRNSITNIPSEKKIALKVVESIGSAANNVLKFVLGRADGGIVEYAANGRIVERMPRIAEGGENLIHWAEPETDWEAYISGKPSERGRNIEILQEAASRLGLMEVPAAPPPAPTRPANHAGAIDTTTAVVAALESAHLTGRLDIGGTMVNLVDARIRVAQKRRTATLQAGRN